MPDRLQNINTGEGNFTPEATTNVCRHRILRWFGNVCRVQRDSIIRQAKTRNHRSAEEKKAKEELQES